ncbi:GTPase-activating protein gyp1 [Astathelohania contejeani]|uniref:GTPase-activating protein gyp1 n=1 Tax=Astathelohania contejeani TaxID=164912 RepID=A0ABQ7I272_9MICR|nr:GTPase-activating protein gyp1 [Thelohania contejeani]
MFDSDRIAYFEKKEVSLDIFFADKPIDRAKLKRIGWGGIPMKHRPKAWRILLGLNDVNRSLINRLKNYFITVLKYNIPEDFLLKGISFDNMSDHSIVNNKLNIPPRIFHQIKIDVERIESCHKTFFINRNTPVDISYMYTNILSVIALRRSAVSYIQGMADLLVPFITVFSAEKDTNLFIVESSAYHAFSRFVEPLQESIISLQSGILSRFKQTMETIDPALMEHLRNINIEIHQFAFRWFNCYFIREFEMENVLVIIDTMLCSKHENYLDFALYFGTALISYFRSELIEKDFADGLMFLQNIREYKWTLQTLHVVFATAYIHQNIFLN